jgi:hypothetical protein
MRRTARGAVDQGKNPAAMHRSQGIEQMRPGLALEDGVAVADLGESEGQRLGNRRRRKLAVDEGLHELPAGHWRDRFRLGDVGAGGGCRAHEGSVPPR